MIAMQGKGVSKGVIKGKLYFYKHPDNTITRRAVTDQEGEKFRLTEAQKKSIQQLNALTEKCRAEQGEEAAILFETHAMFVEDEDYVQSILDTLEEGCNAEYAVYTAGEQFGLMLHDAELADALTSMDNRVPHSDGREVPLVIVAAVAFVEHPHVIGLNDTEVLVCRAAGNHVSLVSSRELHGNAQRNQLKLTLLQFHILSGSQVNPVRLTADVLQLAYLIAQIANLDCFSHMKVLLSLLIGRKLSGLQCIFQKGCDGHNPNTTWDRGDGIYLFNNIVEADITDKFTVCVSVDTHINNDCVLLYHVCCHKSSLAHSRNQNVCTTCDACKVLRV